MTGFAKWTSIEKFSDAIVFAQRAMIKQALYRAKLKLHGTNAIVRVEPDGIFYQKRSQDITVNNDNFGFANWASKIDWNIDKIFYGDATYYIVGEWAGNGINNGDAVTQLKDKKYFIFSIEIHMPNGKEKFVVADPEEIAMILGDDVVEHDDIIILPWVEEAKTVVFYGSDETNSPQAYADSINAMVDAISEKDQYIFDMFGIEGYGEGYVCYPSLDGNFTRIPRDLFGAMVFKAKTAAHSANKTKGAKVKVEVPASIYEFAETYVTDARCEQMITEHCNGEYTMKNTPVFLKALIADIEKETVNEREASGLAMSDANKVISAKAVMWLKNKTALV